MSSAFPSALCTIQVSLCTTSPDQRQLVFNINILCGVREETVSFLLRSPVSRSSGRNQNKSSLSAPSLSDSIIFRARHARQNIVQVHFQVQMCGPDPNSPTRTSFLHSDWSVSYRSEVKARQDVKPDIRQPPFTDYRQPPVDYRHPPVADYRQPPTLDYRHPPLLDYRQLATDTRQFAIPEYRMPPVQVRMCPTQEL